MESSGPTSNGAKTDYSSNRRAYYFQTIELDEDDVDLLILYVLHGIRDGSTNEGNLDALAKRLGFASATGSLFFVKAVKASKESHYLKVNSDGNYDVAKLGLEMGVRYAMKYGPEFGWSS